MADGKVYILVNMFKTIIYFKIIYNIIYIIENGEQIYTAVSKQKTVYNNNTKRAGIGKRMEKRRQDRVCAE